MNEVVAGQRWGWEVPRGRRSSRPAGGRVYAGTADGWLDRQIGIVIIGRKPIAVAIATTAGDHGTATQNLTAIAQWVATHVMQLARPGVRGAEHRPTRSGLRGPLSSPDGNDGAAGVATLAEIPAWRLARPSNAHRRRQGEL